MRPLKERAHAACKPHRNKMKPMRILVSTIHAWLLLSASALAAAPDFTVYRVSGEGITLEWTGNSSLQWAESVSGPWTMVPKAKSPFSADRVGPFRFYRLVEGLGTTGTHTIAAVDENTLLLTFDREMGGSAIIPGNYLISSDEGSPIEVKGAKFKSLSVVELATTTQSYKPYELTINNVQDNSGQPVYFNNRAFSGNPKGAVVSAGATSPTRVVLAFNEPMADNALVPQHYSIRDSSGRLLPVMDADFEGPLTMVVELTTAPQTNVLYTVTCTNITDLGGDTLGATTRTASFQGLPGPTLTQAIATDSTHVMLTFAGATGDSALAPSTYLIEELDAGSNVVGTLAITSARFVGGQYTVVELTTTPQQNVRYRISTGSGLTDRSGNALPAGTLSFDGISGAPTIALVASTGPTSAIMTFNVPMSDDVLSPSVYNIVQLDDEAKSLQVLRAIFVGTERRVVEMTTAPQTNIDYVIRGLSAKNVSGTALVVPTGPDARQFRGNSEPTGTPADPAAPRVVGAASLNNTNVLVAFSEPMSTNAIRPEHYVIIQENVNSEAAYLRVQNAEFYKGSPSTVLLTTSSQNELTYRVTVVNVTDLSGTALSPRIISNGVLVDPTSALFPGTPPVAGVDLVDTDSDGLSDNVEMRGWLVSVKGADGQTRTRAVTSDPAVEDTDGDGLNDAQEANLRFDPRNTDTDDDQINDYAEFNEVYTNGLDQDTDHDGLDDFLEFTFFRTSPLFGDTDGDQIADFDEIIGSRNPRVSDLPRPEITIGAVSLRLDVRFTETKGQEQRELETRNFRSSLIASESQTHTRQDTVAAELHFDIGTRDGDDTWNAYYRGGFSVGYTFQQTEESATATQQEYERSLTTDEEVTRGFTSEREVFGAVMQVAVNLRNLSTLAYRVRNLQITAFIQDPQNHSRLIPVATLTPEAPPAEGFTLGPLAAERGPFIFSNTTIVPSLVEALMANSSGLVFRISNYDIIDEHERNFAFSGQEIAERTARVVIDFGGASSLRALVTGEAFHEIQPGDETEIHRVATSAGRAIADTNEDGNVDRYPQEIFDSNGVSQGVDLNGDGVVNDADDSYEPDTIVVFDTVGKPVGIGLHQAMAAIGLIRYEEATTPTANLSDEEVLTSYSTIVVAGREKIFRIRAIANDSLNRKFWEILTPLGIDQITDLNDLILKPNSPVSLNFVQDLDQDGLTADVEYFLRTSDSDEIVTDTNGQPAPKGRDTDKDGLDDRFEALIGWTVTTPLRTYKVWSAPNRKDSNFDDPADDPLDLYDGSDAFAAPGGWNDVNSNKLRDLVNEVFQVDTNDYVLDPIRKDTDEDGINDADEVVGFTVIHIPDGAELFVRTNPLLPDTDGDTFTDGFERQVGLDPTDSTDLDTDGDGLPDPVERNGWDVKTIAISTVGFQQGLTNIVRHTSSTNNVDTDADGLSDFDEYFLKTNPRAADTDQDGMKDLIELNGYILPHKVGGEDLGIITTDVLDADTDNDKRSDGDEAELIDVELSRWVVRVDGETPIRVFSNPIIADADFDSVVDGDEFAFDPLNARRHTDPNNGDTDGDGRDDGIEIGAGTNPLATDVRVTVIAQSVEVSTPGQYNFVLSVRRPDPTGVAGLSATPTTVFQSVSATDGRVGIVRVHNTGAYVAKVSYRWIDASGATQSTGEEDDLLAGQTRDYNPGLKGVPNGRTFYPVMRAVAGNTVTPTERFIYASGSTAAAKFTSGGTTLINTSFDYNGTEAPVANPEDFPLSGRSISFGLASGERFSIEGTVTGITTASTETVKLGGIEGDKALQESSSEAPTEIRPVFSLPEVQDQFLEEFYFEAVVNGATVTIRFFYLIE